jgi:hypothetical protein
MRDIVFDSKGLIEIALVLIMIAKIIIRGGVWQKVILSDIWGWSQIVICHSVNGCPLVYIHVLLFVVVSQCVEYIPTLVGSYKSLVDIPGF